MDSYVNEMAHSRVNTSMRRDYYTDISDNLTIKFGERKTRFRDVDCSLNRNKFFYRDEGSVYKDANCTLNKEQAMKTPNNMIVNKEGNGYRSCVIYKEENRNMSYTETLQHEISGIKAEYESEYLNNKDIRSKMKSEVKSLMFSATLVIVVASLYVMLFSATDGNYYAALAFIMSIVMLVSVCNLFVNLITYLIDCDYEITRKLGKAIGINPLYVQKVESDLRILALGAEIGRLNIIKDVEESMLYR